MQKTILIILLLVILALVGYIGYDWYQNQPAPQPAPQEEPEVALTEAQARELLQTARLTVPDDTIEVTFRSGTAEYPISGSPIKGMVWLGDVVAVREAAEGNDIFATLVVNSGGTGNFVYLAYFKEVEGEVTYQDAEMLGDRIKVETIGFGGEVAFLDRVVVNILDRNEDEPMVIEPTVPVQFVFRATEGKLQSVEQ